MLVNDNPGALNRDQKKFSETLVEVTWHMNIFHINNIITK